MTIVNKLYPVEIYFIAAEYSSKKLLQIRVMRHDTPEVMLDGYKGHEDVPNNVTHVRFHPSVVTFRNQAFYNCSWLREVV